MTKKSGKDINLRSCSQQMFDIFAWKMTKRNKQLSKLLAINLMESTI